MGIVLNEHDYAENALKTKILGKRMTSGIIKKLTFGKISI